jgi:hypothetical protein
VINRKTIRRHDAETVASALPFSVGYFTTMSLSKNIMGWIKWWREIDWERSERRRSWSNRGTIPPFVSRDLGKPRSILAKTAGVRGKTRTAYFDDVSLEVTTTLGCSICSVKVNKSVKRKLRSSMRKEHVSETTVKTRAWESASSWQTNVRTSESYMSVELTVWWHSLVVMTSDHKDVTYRTFCQGQAHNKRQILIND